MLPESKQHFTSAAKEILLKHLEIELPPVEIRFNGYRDPIVISPAKTFRLNSVVAEERSGSIIPDILADVNGVPLLIEIRVTHAVTEAKAEKIRSLGISAIEIDLSCLSRSFSPDGLVDTVIRSVENKKWIFNACVEKNYKFLLSTGDRKPQIRRGLATHIDYCPINARVWKGKSFANLIDDCANCEFILEIREHEIVCGGKRKITTFDQLKGERGN